MNRFGPGIFFLLLSLAGTACAETVGRIILSAGDVTALRQGRSVPLGMGADVESGDRIRTGQSSNAQIRFTDSAIVALRPDSDFGIDEYIFQGQQNGSERAIFSLFKGGLRTITGLIGKVNQRNYAVRTPAATVGIRGTHFNLVHCADDCKNSDGGNAPNGTYGGVSDGRVAVTPLSSAPAPIARNASPAGLQYASVAAGRLDVPAMVESEALPAEMPLTLAQAPGGGGGGGLGERVFGSGEYFRVPDANTPAVQLLAPPGFLTDKLEGQLRARQGSASATSSSGGSGSGSSSTAGGGASSSSTTASSSTTVDARAQEAVAAPVQLAFVSTEVKSSSGGISVLSSGVTGFFLEYSNGANFFVIGDCKPGSLCGSAQADKFTFDGTNLTSYSAPNFQGSLAGGTVVDSGSFSIAGATYGWGRWTGPFTVTDPNGTSTGATVKSGVLFAYTTEAMNTNQTLPTSGSVSYVLVGGPNPVDAAGNVGTVTSMTGSANFLTRNVGLNMGVQINIPSQGLATMTLSGSGIMPTNSDKLIAAPLSGSCAGAGCVSTSAFGQFDARFGGNAAQVMVVNGGVTNVVKDQILGSAAPKTVLFLDMLKCSGC